MYFLLKNLEKIVAGEGELSLLDEDIGGHDDASPCRHRFTSIEMRVAAGIISPHLIDVSAIASF